ncbi:hypothetical protein LCGC14_2103760 [marine sediment metagenome]|uniref:Uncharacterized protein n=1 Tax=marine sediment metagenome TaxID=412755 RepID=A0A0F9H5K2_9ZZZZ
MREIFHSWALKRGYLEAKRGHERYIKDMFEDINSADKHIHIGYRLIGILPYKDENDNNPEKISHKIFFTCECEI